MMIPKKQSELPQEYRFDVSEASRDLTALAEAEPDAVIVVTLAEWNENGLEAESDVYLSATSAAALLQTLGDDQRFMAGGRTLAALRVARATNVPARPARTEPWDEDQS